MLGECLLQIGVAQKQQTPLPFGGWGRQKGPGEKDGHGEPLADLLATEALLLKQGGGFLQILAAGQHGRQEAVTRFEIFGQAGNQGIGFTQRQGGERDVVARMAGPDLLELRLGPLLIQIKRQDKGFLLWNRQRNSLAIHQKVHRDHPKLGQGLGFRDGTSGRARSQRNRYQGQNP
ncbi:MAG: hypothetical protein ACK583_01910 [Cyanobacteriota bacterium]